MNRTYINVIIVFLLSGLWHGANWTFILWGACHGVFSVIVRRHKAQFESMHPVLNWLITFSFLNVTWVIFRANTIKEALVFLNCIALFKFGKVSSEIIDSFNLPEFQFLGEKLQILSHYPYFFMVVFFIGTIVLLLGSKNAFEKMEEFTPTIFGLIVTIFLMVWCVFSFSGISTFLYFNF